MAAKVVLVTVERGNVMHEAVMASKKDSTLFSLGFWNQVAKVKNLERYGT